MKEFFSEIFATIYETWFGLYDANYQLIFNHLYDNIGYLELGAIFIFIPLLFWLIFYLFWKYPYSKLFHWIIWMLLTVIIVFGVSYSAANIEIFSSNNQALNNAIGDPKTGYNDYAASLPLKFALINSLLSLIIGFIYSLVIKQFSKIQIHLPF